MLRVMEEDQRVARINWEIAFLSPLTWVTLTMQRMLSITTWYSWGDVSASRAVVVSEARKLRLMGAADAINLCRSFQCISANYCRMWVFPSFMANWAGLSQCV